MIGQLNNLGSFLVVVRHLVGLSKRYGDSTSILSPVILSIVGFTPFSDGLNNNNKLSLTKVTNRVHICIDARYLDTLLVDDRFARSQAPSRRSFQVDTCTKNSDAVVLGVATSDDQFSRLESIALH